MRILPVLDLKGGQVVRGVAGRRNEYQPVRSVLCSSVYPRDVAKAFQENFGVTEVYVADLDAIGGAAKALETYAEIRGLDLRLWVDAGIRYPDEAAGLAAAGLDTIVVGLETVAGPQVLQTIGRSLGADRVVFSLDLKGNAALGNTSAWRASDAWSIAQEAIALGVRRLLVLDLSRVGTASGPGSKELCRALAEKYPAVEIAVGGGIRDLADLLQLKRSGVGVALVASALHDGHLNRKDLDNL
jgi:phosphoribosylformimino-5-aminoimidazole carboxamide ribotide isomerase